MSPRGQPQPPPPPMLRPGSTQPQFGDQHLYQNHRPPMMAASPMGRPPSSAGLRSASIQNLSHQQLPPPAPTPTQLQQPPPVTQPIMGQRQASQPALMMNGQPRVTNGEDQGYYQNIGTTNLQQPMPLRYNYNISSCMKGTKVLCTGFKSFLLFRDIESII